ncbi:MAG: response regulator [Anaerolineae bacterium]|nr:response regulator [Anaerolineae bacterium]
MNTANVEGIILVVDDDPVSLEIMTDRLYIAGMKVLVASGGAEALAQIQHTHPDLILLDVLMPDLDGFEVCQRLKEDEATKDIPIIFMTVLAEVADKVKGFKAGAVDYITKSDHIDEIMARIRVHLTLRQTQKELLVANEQLQQINSELTHEIAKRKQIEEKLRQRSRELTLINRASRVFNSSLRLDRVLQTVLAEMHQLLDITGTSFWLLLPDTGELICQHATGPESDKVIGWRLAPGQGLAGHAAQTGATIVVSNSRTDVRHFKEVDQKIGVEMRSILAIPLQTKDRIIGVLNLVDTQVGRFTTDNLELIEPIAVVAAIAIENAQLFDEIQ